MTGGSRRRRSEPGAHSLCKEGGSTWRPRTAQPATPRPAVEAHAGAAGSSRAPQVGPRGQSKPSAGRRPPGAREASAALTEAGAGGVQLL